MRILHLLSHDQVKSGGAFQALALARAQRELEHEVHIAHNLGRDREAARRAFEPLVDEGFPCHGLAMQHLGALAGRVRFLRLVEELRADVIHAHRERAMRFAVRALERRPEPVLVAQKGNCYRDDARTAAAWRAPRIDRIVAVAEAVKRVLVTADGVAPEKVQVIYGSYDEARFGGEADRAAARREIGVPLAAPVVGILANLDRKKGHGLFFKAARRVLEQRPDALFLVIGGGDLEGARQKARRESVLEAVRFLGFRGDPQRVLAALDVSVSCSSGGEGLTGALRESLALGVPVVSTNVGGNAELVVTGSTGLLVAEGDERALAGAVLHLLAHPREAQAMAAEGRRRVRHLMNARTRCEQVLALYDEALAWRALGRRLAGSGPVLHPEAVLFRPQAAAGVAEGSGAQPRPDAGGTSARGG